MLACVHENGQLHGLSFHVKVLNLMIVFFTTYVQEKFMGKDMLV
jgi:hypothetical protein